MNTFKQKGIFGKEKANYAEKLDFSAKTLT